MFALCKMGTLFRTPCGDTMEKVQKNENNQHFLKTMCIFAL